MSAKTGTGPNNWYFQPPSLTTVAYLPLLHYFDYILFNIVYLTMFLPIDFHMHYLMMVCMRNLSYVLDIHRDMRELFFGLHLILIHETTLLVMFKHVIVDSIKEEVFKNYY